MYQMQESFQKVSDAITPFQVPGKAIAVVDDDMNDLFFIKRELRFIFGDMPVITFQSSADILRHLRLPGAPETKPWLILLDLDMPGASGFKTLETLQNDPALSGIPVVVISGSVKEQDVHDSFTCGAKAFLSKPASRQDFAALLHQANIFKPALKAKALASLVTVKGNA